MNVSWILKKIPMIFGAAALAVSGIAAVSAFESHVVNVEAHVENALSISTVSHDFGTVFPEEWLTTQIDVNLSDSFKDDQTRVNTVVFDVYVFCKPGTSPIRHFMGDVGYLAYQPGTPGLPGAGGTTSKPPTVAGGSVQAPWTYIGPPDAATAPNGCTGAGAADEGIVKVTGLADSRLSTIPGVAPITNTLWVGIDVAVCDFNYNSGTDPKPKPSGFDRPTIVLGSGDPGFTAQSINTECEYDIGMEVKFQITAIQTLASGE